MKIHGVQAPATFPIDGKQLPVPEGVAPLFTPHQLGRFQLSNRIAYAPLTRCRAIGHIPQVRPGPGALACSVGVKAVLLVRGLISHFVRRDSWVRYRYGIISGAER